MVKITNWDDGKMLESETIGKKHLFDHIIHLVVLHYVKFVSHNKHTIE